MFHPEVIAQAESAIRDRMGTGLPPTLLTRRTLDERWAMRDQLLDAAPTKATNGEPARPLTEDENAFITSEQLLGRLDYRYWASAWCVITKETQESAPITPFWTSQELFLDRLATLEYSRQHTGHPDGILVNCLKARQLGVSTLFASFAAHRATTMTALRGLIAADVRDQSEYLFNMFEGMIQELPWWLRPPTGPYDTGSYWTALKPDRSAISTTFRGGYGKSSRGGLQDEKKTKGNLGRGKTQGFVWISEYSTWERPEQIRDGLMPSVPMRRRTFVGFESTAKGRHDDWHRHWEASAAGKTRFTNVFIPWYVESDKYWTVPPDDWTPDADARAHAEAVERDSPQWMPGGKTVRLSKEQLAWWALTRSTYIEAGELYKFYEEFPATPDVAFQYAGRSIFPAATLEYLRRQERRPLALLAIEPRKDIAQLAAWERAQPRDPD